MNWWYSTLDQKVTTTRALLVCARCREVKEVASRGEEICEGRILSVTRILEVTTTREITLRTCKRTWCLFDECFD